MIAFNKKISRIVAALCSIIMLCMLVSCNSNKDTPSDSTPASTSEVTYTVTFNSNGGSEVASQTVVKNGKATEPTAPTKSGYEFAGWTAEENGTELYNFDKRVKADLTLYAIWEESSGTTLKATFNPNYEGATSTVINFTSRVTSKPDDPSRGAEYAFVGWFDGDGNEYKSTRKYTTDVTFTAKWLKRNVLEAEHTQLTGLDPDKDTTATAAGNKMGNNRSGEMSGTQLIGKSSTASNGRFIRGLYARGRFITFTFTASEAEEGCMISLALSAEFKDYKGDDGENKGPLTEDDFQVIVNGEALADSYSIELDQDDNGANFRTFVISRSVALKAGENVITIKIVNGTKQFNDGTVNAAAPMIDCMYLYTNATIEMHKFNEDVEGF